ncbi:stage V sporulation protein AC [Clostridium chauvoei]|uniref:stage V sporulation protein AC n=1 Tax=Clostridium chauvoei TaxID=46867 RepID=UPI001C84F9EF|nr:stage V sporulation protein AC [Clostridium chauvoei]MBX7367995.1 stage V sporulation protein AC [Clostridium chauvoei]
MAKKHSAKEQQIVNKFQTITKEAEPKPKLVTNCARSFLVGGVICTIGQVFQFLLLKYGFPEEEVKTILPIVLVFLGALLTGVGIYDKIANFGGAGTVVPITGFANAIVAPAIEFKKEGFVFGVAAKMFTIAGPVLVYGIGSSVIIGIVYYLIQIFM